MKSIVSPDIRVNNPKKNWIFSFPSSYFPNLSVSLQQKEPKPSKTILLLPKPKPKPKPFRTISVLCKSILFFELDFSSIQSRSQRVKEFPFWIPHNQYLIILTLLLIIYHAKSCSLVLVCIVYAALRPLFFLILFITLFVVVWCSFYFPALCFDY